MEFYLAEVYIIIYVYRAVYRIFAKGGELGVCQKVWGARLFVAAGQPQGGGGFKGGRMPPPTPPKYTPDVYTVYGNILREKTVLFSTFQNHP